jgi:hypothetical protein
MKKIILSIGILFCLLTIHAQNKFNYNYDAAGNRILRKQIVLRKKSDDKITHQDSVTEIVNNIQFSIFPNPTTGTVNIISDENFLQKNHTTLYLYDINGKMLKEQEYSETKQNVELVDFPAGKYIIELRSQEGFKRSWNVLKE